MSKTNKTNKQDFLDDVLADREKTDPGITKEVEDEMDDARLGAALVRHRMFQELTQSQVGAMIGKTQPQVAAIERSPLSKKAQVLIDYCKAIGLANPFEAVLRDPEDDWRATAISDLQELLRKSKEARKAKGLAPAPGTLWEVVPEDEPGAYVKMRPVTVGLHGVAAEPSHPKTGRPARTSQRPGHKKANRHPSDS